MAQKKHKQRIPSKWGREARIEANARRREARAAKKAKEGVDGKRQ